MVISSILDWVRRTGSRAGIPSLLNSLGLLNRAYWTYWRIYAYFNNQSILERDIMGNRAAFNVNDWRELRHLHADFEDDILKDLLNLLDSDDVFFDVGAHIGIYSCLVAQGLDEGSVVAYEPNPEIRTRLENNLSHNELSNVSILPYALSDENTEGSISGGNVRKKGDTNNCIRIVRGDDIIETKDLRPPSVVKIDVEGGELMAIKGLETTLRKHCRLIYVEVHPTVLDRGNSPDVRKKLQEMGFEVDRISETENSIFYLRGQKKI